jgi:hypothetical protein
MQRASSQVVVSYLRALLVQTGGRYMDTSPQLSSHAGWPFSPFRNSRVIVDDSLQTEAFVCLE